MKSNNMTDQEYEDIQEACIGSPSKNCTCAKAPPVTVSLYDEALPTLYMSQLVYGFTKILNKRNRGELSLVIPEDFPIKDLHRFLDESVDLTEDKYNDGNGLSFYQMDTLVKANEDELKRSFGVGELASGDLYQTIVERIRDDLSSSVVDGKKIDGDTGLKNVFLTHHRYMQQDKACVYTVVKDAINKRIIVSFRGSQGVLETRDWQTNFNILPARLRTPKRIKDKMKGRSHNRLLVHRGFYNYLFNNRRMDGDQRYDNILKDIKAAIKGEKGYSVYVTGHSLGGALATMFSMKLAGCGEKHNDIPRPITCITFASAISGTRKYRTATEHLERDGFLRHLRINLKEDIVPTLPGFILGFFRLQKHVGINIQLTSSDFLVEHSSRANFKTFLRYLIFKPAWRLKHWHTLPLHEQRFEEHAEEFKKMKLDDLYKDETIVSPDFIAGKI